MLYHWYEMSHAAVRPARAAADSVRFFFNNPFNPLSHTAVGRHAAAACEVFERTTRRYPKPSFNISSVPVDGRPTAVTEEIVWERPFCRLVRLKRNIPDERSNRDPRILLIAPMSGHYATLLRGTVETLLPNHDVFITDWADAREVPGVAGTFDLAAYIDYVIDMLRYFKGDVHAFAVCQPSVPLLAAVALMEEEDDPFVPASMILAGGPVDTRINPTVVNKLAENRGTKWFANNVIATVPWPWRGFGREVYPGFLQLTGFMTMNLDRHVDAHKELFRNLVHGDGEPADKHRQFYDEYLAVMDLTAEFYLDTIESVFVSHALPKGAMRHRGRRVDPSAIRTTALMTIEGEKDDITGLGQCRAAHDLCDSLPASHRLHIEAEGVGHYGIFNGSRFRSLIAPAISNFVRSHDRRETETKIMTPEEELSAIARAVSGGHELSSIAFSFAPANDIAKDKMAVKLRAEGLGATDAEERGPQSAPFRMWALAGRMMIDGMFRMHTGYPTARRH